MFRPRALLLLGTGLALATVAGFTWFSWRLGDATMREARYNLSSMSRMLAEHTTRSIQAADLILRVPVAAFDGRVGATDAMLHRLVRERLLERQTNAPQVRAVLVLDAEGNVILDSASAMPRQFNAADRDYFVVHRSRSDVGLYVGAPVMSRLSGQWVISLSRRINKPDGSFAGVAVMALDPQYFIEFHSTLYAAADASISLYREDGTLLTRYPARGKGPASAQPDAEALVRSLPSGAIPHIHRSVSQSDGVERLRAHMKLATYPMVAAIAMPVDRILSPVRTSQAAVVVAGVTTAVVLFTVFWLLARHLALSDAMARQLEAAKTTAETGWLAAVESEKIKTLFWNGVGHDLRSPLCAIQALVDLLLSGRPGHVTPDQRQHLTQIGAAVRAQFALVDDLSDAARLEAGRIRLHEKEMDLVDLIDQVTIIILPLADKGGVTLTVRDLRREVALEADYHRLLQVVLNVATNAVKYTPAGGEVTIGYDLQPNGGLHIVVADTGIGMTPAEVAHALRPYARVDNDMTRERTGTGLGLSIARGLTELHGGTLAIESEPGKGTTITIAIPAERVICRDPGPHLRMAGE